MVSTVLTKEMSTISVVGEIWVVLVVAFRFSRLRIKELIVSIVLFRFINY